ncbi:NADPH dehydrogenase NamA [Neobacillus niacini]|uniref:NADPH dehydrogenase NamA n=1 Tax=Neobacillus niacini TaxID=86668 RepID=UPI0030000B51
MLFSEYKIKDLTLNNRIVMSPMSMYASKDESGNVTDFHKVHYGSRAIGGVGLIILESTAVTKQGRMSPNDLGIWDDSHIAGLQELTSLVHGYDTPIGIQLNHAGRKAKIDGGIIAPSAIQMSESYKKPKEMSIDEITKTIKSFKQAAIRAIESGFDLIEIHAAHGYLIHEFLSPVTNQRTDDYGGSLENRFRFLKEIIVCIRSIWKGPLFVRISGDEYDPTGTTLEENIYYCKQLKQLDVDLIDVSAGGLVNIRPKTYAGYQVPLSDAIKNSVDIATGAVGIIKHSDQAEEILQNKRADLIFIGRELLWNPHWTYKAAKELNYELTLPQSYSWSWIAKL